MTAGLRRCPCAGCYRDVRRGLLMCAEHWRLVPRRVRAEVKAAWRDYRDALKSMRRRVGSPEATIDASRRHDMAKAAAIAAVNASISQAGRPACGMGSAA